MPLLVWFSVADYSLLLSAEKPQVPATVRGIKRKLSWTLFVSTWQSISSDGGNATLLQTFLLMISYAQTIKKFVGAITHLIENYKIAKKVSGNQKKQKQRTGLSLSEVRSFEFTGRLFPAVCITKKSAVFD